MDIGYHGVGQDAGDAVDDRFARIVGTSVALRRAVQKARLLADFATPVLLQGETGVGKEVFARAIHGLRRLRHGMTGL